MAIYKNTPPIVTNGLICNLDAGNRMSYVGSGTTWTDLSGNNNSGSLVSSPTYDVTNLGSFTTNGTNNYIAIASSSAWNFGTSSFSVGAWYKAVGAQANLVRYDTGLSAGLWWLYTDSTTISFRIYNSNRATNSSVSYTIPNTNGTWHYLVGVRDSGSLMRLYYDGALVSSATETAGINVIAGSGAYPAIGRLGSFNGEYCAYTVSNVHMYNRALSTQQVAQNYNALKSRFGLT